MSLSPRAACPVSRRASIGLGGASLLSAAMPRPAWSRGATSVAAVFATPLDEPCNGWISCCAVTMQQAISHVRTSAFSAQNYAAYSRMAKGGSRLAPYHAFERILPARLKALVKIRTRQIIDGSFQVALDNATPVSDAAGRC